MGLSGRRAEFLTSALTASVLAAPGAVRGGGPMAAGTTPARALPAAAAATCRAVPPACMTATWPTPAPVARQGGWGAASTLEWVLGACWGWRYAGWCG